MSLDGRIVCVTGAGGPLGRAQAEALADAGAKVVAVAATGPEAAGLLRDACDGLGVPDALVVNGSPAADRPAAELGEQAWRAVVDTDLDGAWECAVVVARLMTGAGRGGSIVLVSDAGPRPAVHRAAVAEGLLGLTRSFATELGPHGIRVNTVRAGDGTGVLPWTTRPADVAAAVTWLASDEARYVTGTALPVDCGGGL